MDGRHRGIYNGHAVSSGISSSTVTQPAEAGKERWPVYSGYVDKTVEPCLASYSSSHVLWHTGYKMESFNDPLNNGKFRPCLSSASLDSAVFRVDRSFLLGPKSAPSFDPVTQVYHFSEQVHDLV